MYIEAAIIAVIIFFVMEYNGSISLSKFLNDHKSIFKGLKEDDFDFLVKARYGDGVDIDKIFTGRIRNGLMTIIAMILLFINDLEYTKVLVSVVAGYVVFKMSYSQLKSYYKSHLHQIDSMLPYYLKSLEILIQHYTVPVALGKSLEDAPKIFKKD